MMRLLPLLLLVPGCSTPPPVVVQSEFGTVRAFTHETAKLYADALSMIPQVREFMESSRDAPVVVWALDSGRAEDYTFGMTYADRIELGADTRRAPRFFLGHELAHWFVPGSPFAGLPTYVEEGVADLLALTVTGGSRTRDLEHRQMGEISVPTSDLHAHGDAWHALPLARKTAATRLGYQVVRELGIDRIKEMAAAGAAPLHYVKAANAVSGRWTRTE